ncbi:MAG TPA: SufD family Fe-S cluster assembly protein, partial [Gemmatimonadaceae bacterium]|nr:SufD family Fe-S cluster assembly protein [Gemmatimonadaceae bacterium]
MSEAVEALVARRGVPGAAFGADDKELTPIEGYRSDFESQLASSRNEPEWLRDVRRSAMGRFEQDGFPTMKNEDWHFTSIAPIAERSFAPAKPGASISPDVVSRFTYGQNWHTFVFVNGRLINGEREVPAGVSVRSLRNSIEADDETLRQSFAKLATPESGAFTALNTAFARDGAVMRIAADTVVEKPVHLLFITDASSENAVVHLHNLVSAGRHSQCTIIESHVALGSDIYFSNSVSEVHVSEGARLGHYKLQSESRNAFHVGTVQVSQARDSRYESFSFATGARLSRTNIYTALAGEAAEAVLNGLYMVDGSQQVDHQTRIEHVAPH